MKKQKTYLIIILVLLCISLNCLGRSITYRFDLPLWLDSFGTVWSAYVLGPICGSMVGITGNLICSALFQAHWGYLFTSISLALLVGVLSHRKSLDTFPGAMIIGVLCAVAATAISVPLNYLFHSGMTGNVWGDGVINLFLEWKWPQIIASILGEFYLDFVDKVLTLVIIYLVFRLFRKVLPHAAFFSMERMLTGSFVLLLFLLPALPALTRSRVLAATDTATDYSDYVQTVFSNDNGLPCGEANDIAETNDGILWIGTYAGLYRYNGQEFEWMDKYDSVRNVNCLYTDDEGRLWIGTNDNGLAISINEKIVNVIDQSGGLPSDSVRAIVESSDGYYYIGTTGSMQILSLNSGLKKVASLWEINYADDLTADGNGHVAAVTSDGRIFLLKAGQILCSMRYPADGEQINCCGFSPEGHLLVGTSLGRVHVYDISEGYFDDITVLECEGLNSLNDINTLENGDVFLSAENGIAFIDPSHQYHLINVNAFNNSIDRMLKDYQGNLWFTSSRLGLLRMAPSPFQDLYSTCGMQEKVVNAVSCWQGNYYIGTDSGLDIIDRSLRKEIKNSLTRQLNGVRIRCIFADSQEHLWICTYGQGLLEIDPDGKQFLYDSSNGSFGNRARLVTQLSDGTIAAAGDTGMSFIRDHEILQTIGYADGLINSMILTVTEMPDGTIIAGTDGDGIALIQNGEVARMLTREDGLSSGVILRTILDVGGAGVFLVTSNGLCYMDQSYAIRPLNNFPYFNNYDVWIQDDETLFVTGSSGIYVVDREELLSDAANISYDLLDARKGLHSSLTANSWNYYDGNGHLFLSCDSGVYLADIERYSEGTHAYRMNLSTVYLDGESFRVESSAPINVDRSVRKIELFPEVINFTIQDPNVGYYLEGFDTQWTFLPQSTLGSITYTNVPSGNYRFHLAVFTNDESTILEELIYPIIKQKDIYDKPWFIGYVIGIAMFFIVFLLGLWFRRVYERAQLQIKMGNQTIVAIANTVDAKDERTSQHSQRVADYSVMIARKMGYSEKECENLHKAAALHDIGKIAIPDNILNKPSRLTNEEYAIMKSHTTRGAEILKGFTLIEHIREGALYHHERYDGRGYPQGLKGEEIPQYGRIIGVADAFDAMTANRIYRNQMDIGYVLDELRKGRGTQFDPRVVDIFLDILEEGTIDLELLYPRRQSTAAGKEETSSPDQPKAESGKDAEQDSGSKKDTEEATAATKDTAEAASAKKNVENEKGGAK